MLLMQKYDTINSFLHIYGDQEYVLTSNIEIRFKIYLERLLL